MAIFFIVLLGIVTIVTILIICSTLKINIKELEIRNKEIAKFRLIISLDLFNKIKWLRLKINEKKIEKLKSSVKISTLNKMLNIKILNDYKDIKQEVIKNWRNILEQLNKFEIEKLNLNAKIGTENVISTAYIAAIISTILAIILARKEMKSYYKIEPIYINKNYIYLSINCIISIKLVHIINIIKELKGKEVYQNNGRTSNRRAYANSNG